MAVSKRSVLDYLKTYVLQNGFAPSVREVAVHFECATSTAHKIFAALEDDGLIHRAGARAVRFSDSAGSDE